MNSAWSWPRLVAVGLGGAAGAGLRWSVLDAVGSTTAWVLALNVAGSFVLGAVLAEQWRHPHARLLLHDAAGIGLCGGCTTFSTFALDVADRLRAGDAADALALATASTVCSVVAVVAGAALVRRVQALLAPAEAEP